MSKQSETMKKRWADPAFRAKMSQPRTADVRAKISKANCGRLVGRKLSATTREKMKTAQQKRHQLMRENGELEERNKKISKALKGKYVGELGANWRGGKWDNTRLSNKTKMWKLAVIERDDYTCQICQVRGDFLHIDHIKSWSEYPELRHELSNGRSLCRPCHYYVTFKRKMPKGSKWGMKTSVLNTYNSMKKEN